MSRPALLLLDEPSLGIMPKLVAEIFATVRDIRKKGITVLLVERNVFEALEVADRAYVLQTGRIVLEGTGVRSCSTPTSCARRTWATPAPHDTYTSVARYSRDHQVSPQPTASVWPGIPGSPWRWYDLGARSTLCPGLGRREYS